MVGEQLLSWSLGRLLILILLPPCSKPPSSLAQVLPAGAGVHLWAAQKAEGTLASHVLFHSSPPHGSPTRLPSASRSLPTGLLALYNLVKYIVSFLAF